jgi:hypothetical protein
MAEDLIAIYLNPPLNMEILDRVSFFVDVVLNIERLELIKKANHPTLSLVETLDNRNVLSLRFDALVKLILNGLRREDAFINVLRLGIT